MGASPHLSDEMLASWHSLARYSAKPNTLFSSTWLLIGYWDSSNIYAIDGDYISLIDTGNDYTAFFELFETYRFTPDRIKKIVFTHCHNDHTLGLVELIRRYIDFKDFEVIVHESVAGGPLKTCVKENSRSGAVQGVEDGRTVELSGYEFRVIYTPGHTADSICLLHEPTGTLISGDTIIIGGDLMSDPDQRVGGNLRDLITSLRRLSKMKIRNVLPGHGQPLFGEAARLIEATYTEALRSLASEGGDWLSSAIRCVKMGLAQDALICLDKVLKKDSGRLEALALKGAVLSDLSRLEEATVYIDEVLKRDSLNFQALSSKGFICLKSGRYEEALTFFEAALRIEPDLESALHGKVLGLSMLGRYEEARKIIKRLKRT